MASIDTHILGHAQNRLTIDSRGRVSPYTHNYQSRSLLMLLYIAAHLTAHLRLDLPAHGPSIQNLCCHTRSFTRVVPTAIPSNNLLGSEHNTFTSAAFFSIYTSRRTVQQGPIASRIKPFVHKVLTCQMIPWIC